MAAHLTPVLVRLATPPGEPCQACGHITTSVEVMRFVDDAGHQYNVSGDRIDDTHLGIVVGGWTVPAGFEFPKYR